MKPKHSFFICCLISALHLTAHEASINIKNLRTDNAVSILVDGVIYATPESGILSLKIQHLPTLVRLVSFKKSKIVTRKMIWMMDKTLEISGSINEDIILSPDQSGQILLDDLAKNWKSLNLDKENNFVPSQPFLVYLVNHLRFQDFDHVQKVVAKIQASDHDFWATRHLKQYIKSFDELGLDLSEKQFEHLVGMNTIGERIRFERPKDKYLLLDFSSSDCRPCLKDIDELVLLKQEFQNDLEILSIWKDPNQEAWLRIAKKQKDKITWASLRDDSSTIFKKFEIKSYPTYMIIDLTGQIAKEWSSPGIEKVRRYLDKSL